MKKKMYKYMHIENKPQTTGSCMYKHFSSTVDRLRLHTNERVLQLTHTGRAMYDYANKNVRVHENQWIGRWVFQVNAWQINNHYQTSELNYASNERKQAILS